jgi:hypothetical protein
MSSSLRQFQGTLLSLALQGDFDEFRPSPCENHFECQFNTASAVFLARVLVRWIFMGDVKLAH